MEGGEHNHEVVEEIVEGRGQVALSHPDCKQNCPLSEASQCDQASVDNWRSEEIDRGELGDRLQ